MKYIVLIPARYESTRFPGKPLARICGEEMITRVCRQVEKAGFPLAVATDNDNIREVVERAGFRAVMTSPTHRSGTERVEEAVRNLASDADVVINVQGDGKVVKSEQDRALYFSRSVIPFVRKTSKEKWLDTTSFFSHIGIYAYRADALRRIVTLPESPLEKAESLEQLRWLQNGYDIRVGVSSHLTIGIDTPADLEEAERYLSRLKS